MAEEESKGDAPAEDPKAAQAEEEGSKGFGLSSYGDSAGSKIDSTLGIVGKPLGSGLSMVGAPVGGLVDSIVGNGGLMQAGRVAGGVSGQGAGGMDTSEMQEGFKEIEKEKKEDDELRKGLGGQEQSGENPLGL
ncbi:hypothetical protein MMC13_001421 [Lambiella insularis]|nr:hypothetical protein [Lambiella insularis]